MKWKAPGIPGAFSLFELFVVLFHDHFHILVVPAIANVEKVHTRFELVKVQGLAVRFTAGFFGELNGLAEGIRQADRHVAG